MTLLNKIQNTVPIYPLISFRILFGLLCFFGLLWSAVKGEIQGRYWDSDFHFKYWGFEWLPYPGDTGIILLYILAALGALGIAFGALYKVSVSVFAISFSYLHTVDSSNFINHYYLIWIFALYLFFVPANAAFSLDLNWGLAKKRSEIPFWCLLIFQIQIGIVYTFAGLAKLNPDWIFRAMPLKIWLGQQGDYPILGTIFSQNWVHFGMSWFGAFYDLTIFWWLLWSRSRPIAFFTVLIFHLLSAMLFDIGLFPPLMIFACTLFLSPNIHKKKLSKFGYVNEKYVSANLIRNNAVLLFLGSFLLIQFFLPIRHLFFTNENIRWTQDYYRYGWRVMLVENEGLARFTVKERNSDRFWEVDNEVFLTGYQIKRMSVQPEHIRQFAHFLSKIYSEKYNIKNPIINVDVQVSLNGRVSKRLIPPNLNLAEINDSWGKKDWIFSD